MATPQGGTGGPTEPGDDANTGDDRTPAAGTGLVGEPLAGAPPAQQPLAPTVFAGRYELQRRLARGGMADVYLATDTLLNRPVAVKVLFAEYARDETFVERFRREAQAAARLTHGNIVAIFDWGSEFGTYYIVMEYVQGRSLSEVVRSDGPLPARQAAEITAKVAGALDFAHRNGVVHRDVKPGNVMISTVGEVKVADFGIAQALTAGDRASLTQTGAVMGTATYFSPEQAQGHAVDPRSDLYSLGCVLFELLTGTAPFAGDSPVAIAYKHVQEPAPTLASRGVEVPAGLQAIVTTLLNKDPDHRYGSAGDLQADLQRFLDGDRVVATAAAPVAAASPGGPVLIGASGGQPPAPGTAAPRSGGRGRGWAVALMVLGLVVVGLGLFIVSTNLSSTDTNQVVVPQVINRPLAEAEQALRAEGLEFTVVREVNESVPQDVVFDQDPSGGSRVDRGSSVELRVSAGLGQVEVPDVVGRTESDAVRLLDTAGLGWRSEERDDDEVPAGRVIIQNPPAGSMAERGSEVVIVVSTGSTTVEVPNLVNQTETSAANQLGRLDLVVDIERVFSPDAPTGVVVATRPAPGTRVNKGDTVILVVSQGPEPTTSTAAPTTTTTTAAPTTTTTAAP